MADYSSGEFHPNDSGSTKNPGAALLFNGKMCFFNSGTNGRLYMAYCTTPNGDVTADNSWFNVDLPRDAIGARPVSDVPVATVIAKGYVYLFWLDSDWDYVVCTRMDQGMIFSEYAIVHDKDGNQVGNSKSAISAVVIKGKKTVDGKDVDLDFIVLSVVDGEGNTLSSLVFDADNFVAGDVFKASHSQCMPASTFAGKLGEQDVVLFPFSSTAFYSQGAGTESNGHTQNYIMQSLVLLHKKDDDSLVLQRAALSLQLDGVCQPVWGDFTRAWVLEETAYTPFNPINPLGAVRPGDFFGVTVRRDPGGRIKAYWRDFNSAELRYRIFDTSRPSSDSGVWKDPQRLQELAYSNFAPVVEFSLGEPLESGNAYAAREWVFYTKYPGSPMSYGDVECQVAYTGKLVRAVDAEVVSLTDVSNSDKNPNGNGVAGGYRMLRGYIDGPVPLPNVNVAADPTKVTNAGCINYGESQSSTVSYSVSQKWTVGIKSSGSTAVGLGPAWDMSISGGEASSWGDSSYQSSSTSLRQNIAVIDDAVVKKGTAFLSDIVLHRDEFQFIPAGESAPTTEAPSFNYIWTEFPSTVARSYDVFTTSPGDLASYTRSAWDAKMKAAGYGDNYFANVIEANALDLDPDEFSVQKCLSYSWTSNGDVLPKSSWAKSSFTDAGWTFSSSFYAGFSFSFFGASQGSVLAGAEFDYESSTHEETSSAWEIEANFTCPSSLEVGAVSYYDFSLWILPADRRWTEEFVQLCTDKELTGVIDPSSEAWKVVCLVERYGTISELDVLTKHGLSAERVAKLREVGIRTTGHLARKLRAVRPEDLESRMHRGAYAAEDLEVATALRAYMAANEYVDPQRRKLYPTLQAPKDTARSAGQPSRAREAKPGGGDTVSGTA